MRHLRRDYALQEKGAKMDQDARPITTEDATSLSRHPAAGLSAAERDRLAMAAVRAILAGLEELATEARQGQHAEAEHTT